MKTNFPIITSRANPFVIETAALAQRKHRDEAGLFILEGEKLVREAAEKGLPVVSLVVTESRAEEFYARLHRVYEGTLYENTAWRVVSDACFSKISTEKSPQGVIAVVKHLDIFKRLAIIYDEELRNLQNKRVILLYAMQDPGNLGAVIRSAVAFGAETLIVSTDCADLYNPKTVRAAMGSLFHLNILTVEDFASAVRALQSIGRRVLAAELRDGAVALDEANLRSDDCIIIGNEGHGIPEEISAMCDASVYLPISSGAESLNAASAASVFLWELQKCK